jgi:hypothetical protein
LHFENVKKNLAGSINKWGWEGLSSVITKMKYAYQELPHSNETASPQSQVKEREHGF